MIQTKEGSEGGNNVVSRGTAFQADGRGKEKGLKLMYGCIVPGRWTSVAGAPGRRNLRESSRHVGAKVREVRDTDQLGLRSYCKKCVLL